VIEVNGPRDAEFGSIRFIRAIRACPQYSKACIVGMVENTGDNNYPQFWDEWWSRFPPYRSATNLAHPLHLPGVPTGEKEKARYDDRLNQLLATNSIAFERRFITGMDSTAHEAEHVKHVKGILRNQLREYCIITKQSEQKGVQIFNKTRSGKHGGGQDDMAMALQIVLYHSKRAMQEDQRIRDIESEGYPFRWGIDEAQEERTRRRELESKIPLEVRLAMPIKEQASAAEKLNTAKRRRIAEVVKSAEASEARSVKDSAASQSSSSGAAAAAAGTGPKRDVGETGSGSDSTGTPPPLPYDVDGDDL
jgi:hypothetical protein